MPDTSNPRHGSMQFWPRKRASRPYARIRSQSRRSDKPGVLAGFAGYKVGMTHLVMQDNLKTSMSKGANVSVPVTIIECPPVKVAGIRLYKENDDRVTGQQVVHEAFAPGNDKHLGRRLKLPKKQKQPDLENMPEYDELRLLVYTQPSRTGIGKKKPDIFEMVVNGSKEDQLTFAKERLGKEIGVNEVLDAGEVVDMHAITKGKGVQGPVKRYGVSIRQIKSEKTKRGPGSISGGWKAQHHMMYRVAFAGKMGYHQRMENNKWIMKVSDDPTEVNVKGGFVRYGEVKNPFILVKGSVPGPSKRLIRMTPAVRAHKRIPQEPPVIKEINLESPQGR